ncbi:MAG: 1-acyl-sn-glycerol-3-phosphate acyltransferase [Planctomycetes bacterium]|nr:1-acyl-sn-glycerol-3-phosphate acyltransferase [Planctomycetota bacterium]MCL4730243.1 1-acyl-sn-glycerol-3-phosphate acyltransferase [Planctomycetota bacterium]
MTEPEAAVSGDDYSYPRRGNPLMNSLRTAAAFSLLWTQLVVFLFLLEVPYWLWDRFVSRHRGDAFYAGQKRIVRWFFRLYPFGRKRLINVSRGAFPQPCVVVINHQSMLDILLALLLPINARWIIKQWAAKIPLMGELNRLARHIVVEESDEADPSRPRGFETALEWLKQGVSIVVFPEGSRSPDGRMRRFKNGAFMLAVDAQVPIVPVIMHGTGACVRKGSPAVNPPDLVVQVLAPVSTAGVEGELGAARLKADVQDRMQAALARLRSGQEKAGVTWPIGVVSRLGMFVCALLIAALAGLSIYVSNFCIAEPPKYDGDRSLAQASIITRDEATRLGRNWRRKRDGVHEVALVGDAWQRGYANARLNQDLVEKQEQHLLKTAREFLPNRASLWLVKQLVGVNNRRLPEFVTEAEKLEVLGLAEGSVDHHPDDVPLYHRILNYHAVHDISHMFIDSPLVSRGEVMGCTGFAAWGKASFTGDLMVGRNFDFEAGPVFDDDKAVLYVWPEGGIPYVHVAWAGMAGAVTGMNAKGLYIHLNAGRTEDTGFGRIGTPVCMLVRRVLESAGTIDEAFALIRDADVFVSDSFLVASRADGRAVVIEKSPTRCAMRQAGREGLLLQTNHFLTEPFTADAENRRQIETATTQYRWARLEELTDRHYGQINPGRALEILRDRKGHGDKELGFGNRNAIDAGICSHSVVVNVTTGEMWVSTGPHTFGKYIRVDVRRMLGAGSEGALRLANPAEFDLSRDMRLGVAGDLQEFRKVTRTARVALDSDDLGAAETAVRTCVNLNPQSFETEYLRGRLAFAREKYADAAKHFQTALDRDPHYEEVRAHIRVWLKRAEQKQ